MHNVQKSQQPGILTTTSRFANWANKRGGMHFEIIGVDFAGPLTYVEEAEATPNKT